MKYLFLLMLATNLYAQFDIPIELYQQFNGKYGYTIIGNTNNQFDNWQFDPTPPCQMLSESSAFLDVQSNQTIVAAYLYWSGIGDGSLAESVVFNGNLLSPDVSYISDINPPPASLFYFTKFKEVTEIIQLLGNNNYTLSSLNLNPIIDLYCSNAIYFSGWSMIVIYEDLTLPNSQLNIYNGFKYLGYDNINSISLPITNLNIVETSNAKISYIVWNGSPNLFFNESVLFNGNVLSNALNPNNNPFNGTNSFTESTTNWNQDIDTFNISNFINIGDTEATLTLNSFFIRFLQTIVTSIPSELPDATVQITDVSGQEICNNRDLTVNYTVFNTNSNAVLPANVPISFFANETFLQTVNTTASIPIGDNLPLQTVVSIPAAIPDTFTLRIVVNEDENNNSSVAESNFNNNETTQIITFLDVSILPSFSLQISFCQNAAVPILPNISDNGISGTWSPAVISNQSSGVYVFTPNAGQCATSFTLTVTITPELIPIFSINATFCQNATVPILPSISDNGISGTWLPSVISNQASGVYVFTPNAGQCATSFTLNVSITPENTPLFSIPTTFCQNAAVPILPSISDNGISGTWSPSVISNQANGVYVFTPNAGQCATSFTLNVTITPENAPLFSIPTTFCENAAVPILPNSSDNGISGTWSPSVISNQASGVYVFTPNAGQCATSFTLNVTITPENTPSFSIPTTFCQNAMVPILPNSSDNGISGTWSPSVISNQASGIYIFTPDVGLCTASFSLQITITPPTVIERAFELCVEPQTNATITLNTFLSVSTHSFAWFRNNQSLPQTSSFLNVTTEGNYRAIATLNGTGCQTIFDFSVNAIPLVNVSFNTSQDFSSFPFVQVNANGGSGNFVYSFNGAPFQTNPTFSSDELVDVLIEVRDTNGCFSDSFVLTLWNYPKFFTPNGDGFNDTWGIFTLRNIHIDIFDRYGTWITRLQNNQRWDGTFNNKPLPSSDYWFVLYYDDKVYRSHFSLKR